MFIYIDETFNLEKGKKDQFMAVAGFSTFNPQDVSRWYQKVKRKSLPKKVNPRELKSTDRLSSTNILPKIFSNDYKIPQIKVGAVIQYKKSVSHNFYHKGQLNYDKLYLELVRKLLEKTWKYEDKEIVIVTLDTFITKTINKEDIVHSLKTELKLKNPGSNFNISFGTSEEGNLQFADQICGIVHKFAKNEDSELIGKLKSLVKVRIIKNPFEY